MSSSLRGNFAPHRFTSLSRSNAPSVSERGDQLQPTTVFGVEVDPLHAGNDVGAIVNGHQNPVGGAAQPELNGRSAVEDGIGNKFVDHYYEIAGQVRSDCPSGQHVRSEPTDAGHGFCFGKNREYDERRAQRLAGNLGDEHGNVIVGPIGEQRVNQCLRQILDPTAVDGKCADKVIDPVFDVATAMFHQAVRVQSQYISGRQG